MKAPKANSQIVLYQELYHQNFIQNLFFQPNLLIKTFLIPYSFLYSI